MVPEWAELRRELFRETMSSASCHRKCGVTPNLATLPFVGRLCSLRLGFSMDLYLSLNHTLDFPTLNMFQQGLLSLGGACDQVTLFEVGKLEKNLCLIKK